MLPDTRLLRASQDLEKIGFGIDQTNPTSKQQIIHIGGVYLGGSGNDRGNDFVEVGLLTAIVGQSDSLDLPGRLNHNFGGLDGYLILVEGEEVMWSRYVGYKGFDSINSVSTLGDSIVVVGSVEFGENSDIYVAKISLDGEIGWELTTGGEDRSTGVAVETNKEEIFVGAVVSSPVQGLGKVPEDFSGLILRLNSTGEVQKMRYLWGSGIDMVTDLSTDGEILLVTGRTSSFSFGLVSETSSYSQGTNGFIVRINRSLESASLTILGGSRVDLFYGVTLSRGLIYVIGQKQHQGHEIF